MKTENFDVPVVPEEGKKIRIRRNYKVHQVHYETDIPMNTVHYTVTYNSELVNFWTDYEAYETEEDSTDIDNPEGDGQEIQYQGGVELDYYYVGDEFDLFMRNKDKILGELKNGQIGSYRTESIKSIELWMNPEMKPYIELS